MLVIRLSRQGRRNSPTYRLVVAENSKATDGSFVEIVGNYNSIAKDQPLVVEKERIEYWISQGAKPSNTVAKLLNRVGFDLSVEKKSKAPKKKAEEAKTAPQAANAPVTEEAGAIAAEPDIESPAPTEEAVIAETVVEAPNEAPDSPTPAAEEPAEEVSEVAETPTEEEKTDTSTE
ncbi:30S ribosomal protein S16 [Patescibacteria group bacterium]|nr:30S ribosomal protein S16 [Patescibacteria group bacterium]